MQCIDQFKFYLCFTSLCLYRGQYSEKHLKTGKCIEPRHNFARPVWTNKISKLYNGPLSVLFIEFFGCKIKRIQLHIGNWQHICSMDHFQLKSFSIVMDSSVLSRIKLLYARAHLRRRWEKAAISSKPLKRPTYWFHEKWQQMLSMRFPIVLSSLKNGPWMRIGTKYM